MTIEGTRLPERDKSATGLGELTLEEAQRYRPMLEGIEISEEQQIEMLGILWSMMRQFVLLGFDVGSFDFCGQLADGLDGDDTAESEMTTIKALTETEYPNDQEPS